MVQTESNLLLINSFILFLILAVLKGDVGCNITITSYSIFSNFSILLSACFKTSISPILSPDKYFGLINGASIPYFLASFIINLLSLDKIVLSISSTSFTKFPT